MTRMMSAFGTEVFMRRLFVAAGVVLLMGGPAMSAFMLVLAAHAE
jgi:hypothetical protein